ncbi:MAG: AgmX/PglI C-terminal domain-containing protein [Sandaracinaceae bacterium]
MLEPGARFSIRQSIVIRPEHAALLHRDAQLDVEVLQTTPQGRLDMLVVLDRPTDPVPIGVLQLVVDAQGSVEESHLVCGGVSDHDVIRAIPHLLDLISGPRPALRSELATDRAIATEAGTDVLQATVSVEDVWYFRFSLNGDASMTVTRGSDREGRRSATVSTQFAGSILVHGLRGQDDVQYDGRLNIEENIQATLRASPVSLAAECARAPLSTEEVRQALSQDRIRMCWETELTEHPGSRGQLVLHLTVRPDGTLSDVHIADSTIPTLSFADCLIDVVSQARAPRGSPNGPANFTLPWTFQP